MEKVIWVIEKSRADMLDIQRKINAFGSMRSTCILSSKALEKTIHERLTDDENILSSPSLILINYDIIAEEADVLNILKSHPKLAGVPMFFVVEDDNKEIEEDCYYKGAMVVLKRPISQSSIIRIERAAWQYEITKNYERILQKQVTELESAKEIRKLNSMLESRNDFLYRIFGKYFSDEVIDVILKMPEGGFIGGDRRELVILLSDLRGFSSIAEEMSADSLADLLNCFFGTMLEIITKYGGTVIEFMGDGVLAVFGAPVQHENDCENALAAAIAMQNAMQKVNSYCVGMGYDMLEMGIGVHCGEGFVGNVGTEKMMRYNVIGRVVNECSRIEGCSVGGQVLISQDLMYRISSNVKVVSKMQISAKGVSRPLDIYEVKGIGGDYQCYLETRYTDIWYSTKKEIIMELYPIQNKLIHTDPIKVLLRICSTRNAIVRVCEPDKWLEQYRQDGQNEQNGQNETNYNNDNIIAGLTLFSDVEVRITKSESNLRMPRSYAKIIHIDGNELTLHFTYKNRGFTDFIMEIVM